MKKTDYTVPVCEVENFAIESILCSSFSGEHEGFEEFIVGEGINS